MFSFDVCCMNRSEMVIMRVIFGFLIAGLLLLVRKHIPLRTMIFVYCKHYGTLTVILIWESFLLTQFSGKSYYNSNCNRKN